jgi:hypothetical protein
VKYYLIKHKPTGKFLTRMFGAASYPPHLWAGSPRLFSQHRTAKGWITDYAKGYRRTEFTDGYFEPPERIETRVKEPHHIREDFEIVTATLTLESTNV